MNFHRYVTTLRKLAESCEFGILRDSIIRDRIIFHIDASDLRKRLLTKDDLTLDKCLEMCAAHEEIGAQSNVMAPSTSQASTNNSPPPPIAINPLISDEQLQFAVEAIKRQRGGNLENANDGRVGTHSNQPFARDRKFKCSKCEFKGTSSTTLSNHLRTHTGEEICLALSENDIKSSQAAKRGLSISPEKKDLDNNAIKNHLKKTKN